MFAPFRMIEVHAPEDSSTGCDFDQAVKPKANQGNAAGNQPRSNGHDRFKAVPYDGEVLKALTCMDEGSAFFEAECRCGHNHFFGAAIELTLIVSPFAVPIMVAFAPANLSICALSPFSV